MLAAAPILLPGVVSHEHRCVFKHTPARQPDAAAGTRSGTPLLLPGVSVTRRRHLSSSQMPPHFFSIDNGDAHFSKVHSVLNYVKVPTVGTSGIFYVQRMLD